MSWDWDRRRGPPSRRPLTVARLFRDVACIQNTYPPWYSRSSRTQSPICSTHLPQAQRGKGRRDEQGREGELYSSSPCVVFLFFIFIFYKNIFSIWKFTEIYLGRPVIGRQGLICKKKTKRNCRQVPGDRPPGSGAAGLIFCNLAIFAK